MRSFLDKVSRALRRQPTGWSARCARLPRHTLAWGSIALALDPAAERQPVRRQRAAQRQGRPHAAAPLHDLGRHAQHAAQRSTSRSASGSTISKRLGEAAPVYGRYFERVRALLEQYRDISGGKLELAIFDPEPFSDAEDRAVAAGLRGVRLNQDGETGYFGLVGTNATDNDATIPFFTTDREPFLEYDLTKLIYTLANPKKRVVGLITGLPLDGGMNPMAMMGGGRQHAAADDHGADPRVLRGQDAGPGRQGDPGRRRRADGGPARPPDARGRLRHRPVRAGRRQGAGLRRSGGRDGARGRARWAWAASGRRARSSSSC